MLLVTIGYRQKGGVSKTRVGEILGLEAAFYLDELLSQGLIYCDPSRELNFWRPTSEALKLRRLHLRPDCNQKSSCWTTNYPAEWRTGSGLGGRES